MDNPTVMDAARLPLYMVYQPVLRINQAEIEVVAYESLLRVRPNSGDHSTLSVITSAEQNGTMPALDTLITRLVCGDAVQIADMRLWINLSQLTLSSPRAAQEIAGVIADHGLACRTTIEMTETADGKESLIMESLRWLKSRQIITVVIDDIDDGYAKSHLLRSDLITGCKLSRRSTIRMCRDPQYMETITKLVRWCKANGKSVVMEGIENKRELATALELGADFCQGVYFWAPLPLAEVPAPGTRTPLLHRTDELVIVPAYQGAAALG